MKKIRNGFITVLLVFAIAAGGMFSTSWLLGRMERQELERKTEDIHEEITLSEEETDHLVLVLKALEEDNLINKAEGSGASIPKEKAWTMMRQTLEEMDYLMLYEYFPDFKYLINGEYQWEKCELLADKNNLSLEIYQISIILVGEAMGVEILSMMDARSGLMISLDLSFTTNEESINKINEENYQNVYDEVYGDDLAEAYGLENDAGIDKDEQMILKTGYSLDIMRDYAMMYYSLNTNFDFSIEKESGQYYLLKSRDKDYSLEITQENTNFHFQLHKFDL